MLVMTLRTVTFIATLALVFLADDRLGGRALAARRSSSQTSAGVTRGS